VRIFFHVLGGDGCAQRGIAKSCAPHVPANSCHVPPPETDDDCFGGRQISEKEVEMGIEIIVLVMEQLEALSHGGTDGLLLRNSCVYLYAFCECGIEFY
jgi:hypothetical protein